MSEAPAELWLRPTARRHWYQAQHEPPEPDAVRYVRADDAERQQLRVENIRIMLCDDPELIALDRDGEGGHFSLREFADMLHQFISERL